VEQTFGTLWFAAPIRKNGGTGTFQRIVGIIVIALGLFFQWKDKEEQKK